MSELKYILILLLFLFSSLGFSQQRKPFIKNFTPKHYGLSNNVQNWAVVQGNNGIVYFGNNTKVLEYDGKNWESINITPNGFVISLAKGNNDRIYVGSINEFGFIDIDKDGVKKYYSISESLKDEDKGFGKIIRTFYVDSTVYFFSQKQIYIYKDKQISLLKPTIENTSFHLAFMVNKQLFVRQRGLGLLKYENNKLEFIKGSEVFENEGVFGIIPFSNKYLIITQEIGLFEFLPSKNIITKIENNDIDKLISYKIFGAIKLHNNKIALNTAKNGVVIIDSIGVVNEYFNEKTGIIDNGVNAIYQDLYNDLWLATNNGISRINYSSPVSFYNEKTGLYGNVFATVRYNNRLFVGTTNGLFVQAGEMNNRFFKRIKNLNYSVTDLLVAENNLIIGTSAGAFSLSENENIVQINNFDSRKLLWVEEKKLLFSVGLNGLAIYNYFNKWNLLKLNENIVDEFRGFDYEFVNGNIRLWAGSKNSGIFRIDIDENLNIDSYLFFAEAGLDDSWVSVFKYNNKVYFSQRSGVYEYMSVDRIKTQTVDSLKHYITQGEFVGFYGVKIPAGKGIYNIKQQNNEIFANVENQIMYGQKNDSLSSRRFNLIEYQVYNNIYLEENTTLWMCSNNGLFAYDLLNKYNTEAKPILYNRQVKCSVDSVLFNGNNKNTTNKIDYNFNTLTFDYSSLYIQNGKASTYSYKLRAYDDSWSEWTTQTNVKRQKLHEGKYTFMVKAKTIYGVESDVVTYDFEILRPWYRSIFAYILYLLGVISIIILLIRLYTARLKAQNIQLEKIVKERTAEVVHQKDEIEKQKDKITHIHNEVKDSINYAERIQKAVLPSKDFIDEAFDEHFILFKPKDVVSGDYYWAFRNNNILTITVADCTGHGVPGAFMSMLGISFLNEIVSDTQVTTASQILDELRKKVIFALKQKGIDGEQKDGMDMSICVIDLKTNIVQWSGANNPLYILSDTVINVETENTSYKIFEDDNITITDRVLYEIKSDKMPVAHYIKMDNFANNVFKLKKGDKLYMFSDGYADQFGGPKGKKYKYKPFKRLIINSSDKTMEEQNAIFDDSIEKWKAYTDSVTGRDYEQIDDICLIGIKL